MGKHRLSRRKFGRRIITLVVIGAGLQILQTDSAQTEIRVTIDLEDSRYSALRKVGGSMKILPEGSFDPVIIVHLSEHDFVAFSSACPHRACEVDLPDADGIVLCPCHNSTFDLHGRYLGGPANQDLLQVAVEVVTPTPIRASTWGQLKKRL
jgi:Rieske Fe-S protein